MLGKHGEVTRRLAAVALGGALLVSLGACSTEDQNALIVYGPDSAVVVAPLTAPAFLMPPGGAAEASELELIEFNATALDAFGRTNALFDSYFPRWYSSGYWSWGSGRDHVYDWDTGDVDPRLPALTRDTPLEDPWRMYIATPIAGWADANEYDIYGETCCLEPDTRYIAGFERMYLTVNGELDAAQVLLGQPVDQPDELKPLGGQLGGDHTRPADEFNVGTGYPAEANANPYVFGYVTTFDDGYMVLDVVVSCLDAAGVQIWICDQTSVDYSPVAPNEQVRHNFPNYNYVTIWEANPDGTPNFQRPVLRKQMGTDLSELGGPINNAYAPFPRAALSEAELALGTGGVSRPADVTLLLDNLKELAGGANYAVWAVFGDGSTQSLEFIYNDGAAPVTSFVGGEGPHQIEVEYPDDATHIMVSIESGPTTSAPSDQQILWAPGLQEAGQPKSLDLPVVFGTFGVRTYEIAGAGSGGLFGDEFRERYNHLPRPPVGYKYVAWLASGDTLFVRLPDESFTSPPPEYAVLEAADTDDTISNVVQPLEILAAFSKICLTEVSGCQGPYDLGAYDTFVLTLEPRAGVSDEIGPTRVLEALVPTPKPRE